MSMQTAAADAAGHDMLNLTSQIVTAYMRNNPVPAGDLPSMIKNVYGTLCGLTGTTSDSGTTSHKPVVPVKKSITPDYIVCLEDGKRLKMLKRYLRGKYDLSPDDYRRKWGLPRDYPMVAPNYSVKRSEFAKQIGLGRTKSKAAPKRRKRA